MATNQEARQASVRAVTGTTLPHNGDWHALFDLAGIRLGTFDERLLGAINQRLGTTYANLPQAQAAFAVSQGYSSWSSMGTFNAGPSGTVLLEDASFLLLEDGVSHLLLEA